MSRDEEPQVTGLGPVTTQVSMPVGIPPGPETVAVKVKEPPVSTPAALSLTIVVEAATPTLTPDSEPELAL
jgi:hypothetical protein